jgi:protein-S-isoprenylcysteine O-methyltransferase Ste14
MKSLGTKTILGFAQLFLFLAAILFSPAWTLHYWQAWVYLAVFESSAALITLYLWMNSPALLERRVKAGPGAEKQASQNWIQAVASLAFLGEMVVPSLDHRFSWSHVPLPAVVGGELLVALGFLGVFFVFRANAFTSATIEVGQGQQVISTGPYAWVRHPMYSSTLLMLLATPVALGSWWGLLMFIPMTLVIVARLLDEEKFLVKGLDGYAAYCAKVRIRLVPFVW